MTINFTSAAIGNTGQSLDGVNVSTSGGPALFLESVTIGDPQDGGALAPVSSTLGLTVNVASTVAQVVNVSTTVTISGANSTQIISSIPFYVSQSTSPWVVSTAPIALVGTSQVFGTVSSHIISSIPFYVSQSTSPWIVSTAPIALVGTSMVNIVSSIPLGGGTQYANSTATSVATGNVAMWTAGNSSGTVVAVSSSQPLPVSVSGQTSSFVVNAPNVNVTNVPQINITTSIPFFVAQSSAPWSIIGGVQVTNVPTVNVTNVPAVTVNATTFVSISSSQPIIVAQSTVPWTVNVSNTQYLGGATTSNPTGNMLMFSGGISSQTMTAVNNSSNPLPVYVASSITQSVQGSINVSSFTAVASVTAIPSSQGGLTPIFKIGLTTASFTVKATAGKLHDIWFTNTATSTRWLKLYNASAAAIGTTPPWMTFGMPGTTTGANAIAGWISSAMGIQFSTAIFAGATASSATSTDTSTPASGDIVINFGFA